MARKEIVNQIVKLYQKLGGNVSDVLGTKTNVSFIGKGEPEILKMDLNNIQNLITRSLILNLRN